MSKTLSGKLLLKRSNRTLRKGETVEDALHTLTHLHMWELGLHTLGNLSTFTDCICIYAYDNCLENLDGLDVLDKLQELQVQHNQIEQIPLLGPYSLRKLDLRHNHLSRVSGLEQQPELEELYLSDQTPNPLELPEGCFQSQSDYLYRLEIAHCGLTTLSELSVLHHLEILNLAENNITSIAEVGRLLQSLPELRSLDLRGNPICKQPRYREKMIVLGRFDELDGKEVLPTQRETLLRMALRKQQTRSQSQAKPKAEPKIPSPIGVSRLQ